MLCTCSKQQHVPSMSRTGCSCPFLTPQLRNVWSRQTETGHLCHIPFHQLDFSAAPPLWAPHPSWEGMWEHIVFSKLRLGPQSKPGSIAIWELFLPLTEGEKLNIKNFKKPQLIIKKSRHFCCHHMHTLLAQLLNQHRHDFQWKTKINPLCFVTRVATKLSVRLNYRPQTQACVAHQDYTFKSFHEGYRTLCNSYWGVLFPQVLGAFSFSEMIIGSTPQSGFLYAYFHGSFFISDRNRCPSLCAVFTLHSVRKTMLLSECRRHWFPRPTPVQLQTPHPQNFLLIMSSHRPPATCECI